VPDPEEDHVTWLMNTTNFFTGVAITAVALLLLFAGPQLILIPSVQTQTVDLFQGEAFTVGDIWERSLQLDEGVNVNGTLAVTSALTGETSEVLLLVMDDENYQRWVALGSPTYLLQKDVASGGSFSFAVPRTGIYHLVFDNASSPVKKNVKMTVDLQRQVVVTLPDERLRYVAYGLLAFGILITAVGILRKTQVPWS